MSTVDFLKMSDQDLLDSVKRIDKEKFPQNYAAAVAEINKRGLSLNKVAQIIDPNRPRPWVRFWAKWIDMTLITNLTHLGYILFLSNVSYSYFWLFTILFFSLYEIYSTHYFGTTLGKYIFSISIENKEGKKPTLKESLHRTFQYQIWGAGLFGLFSLFTYIFSYIKLTKTGTTRWDEASGTIVRMGKAFKLKLITIFLLSWALLLGYNFLTVVNKRQLHLNNKVECKLECKVMLEKGQLKKGVDYDQCIKSLCGK